jgi:hypothetical protein
VTYFLIYPQENESLLSLSPRAKAKPREDKGLEIASTT